MTLKTIERPAVTLVGLQIETRPKSPEIPALWPKFVARIPEIAGQTEPRVTYGVMRHGDAGMHVLHRYDESFDPMDPGSAVGICLPVRRRGEQVRA